jgi:hypothetical protein
MSEKKDANKNDFLSKSIRKKIYFNDRGGYFTKLYT